MIKILARVVIDLAQEGEVRTAVRNWEELPEYSQFLV